MVSLLCLPDELIARIASDVINSSGLRSFFPCFLATCRRIYLISVPTLYRVVRPRTVLGLRNLYYTLGERAKLASLATVLYLSQTVSGGTFPEKLSLPRLILPNCEKIQITSSGQRHKTTSKTWNMGDIIRCVSGCDILQRFTLFCVNDWGDNNLPIATIGSGFTSLTVSPPQTLTIVKLRGIWAVKDQETEMLWR